MTRKKPEIKIKSYGIFTSFDSESKQLPHIQEFTTEIPAQIGIEFGYILNIKKARGQKLTFLIEHPPFPNQLGQITPPFTGEIYIRSNDFNFFLGDTVWEPAENKIGPWTLKTFWNDNLIAEKTFQIVPLR